jgi:hypothetical protein
MNPDLDCQPRQPGRWPFPGDSPLVRARKVAQMYRAALGAADEAMREQCDATAVGYGETWAVPRLVVYADDDLLRPADAADFLCVSTSALGMLRSRGRLRGVWDGRMWLYRVAELRQLQCRRTKTVDVVAGATPHA